MEFASGTVILHRGARYCVRFLRCTPDPSAVVCFEYWVPHPSLDVPFAAEGFFANRGVNALGILAAENDWFLHAEIADVLAAIQAATPGFRLVGYGGSMGAHAAINYSAALRLHSVIAVCPQYSIDADRAPYETRWRGEALRIGSEGGFARDQIDEVSPLCNGWLVYDPASVDARHAAAIQGRHRLGELTVRFGGHEIMRMLQQSDVYTGMLLDMLADCFDQADFRRLWRVARRRSAVYWLGVSDWLLQRGNGAAAGRAVAQARTLPHPEPAELDLAEARALLACGHRGQAGRLAEIWVEHPGWGDAARKCLARAGNVSNAD